MQKYGPAPRLQPHGGTSEEFSCAYPLSGEGDVGPINRLQPLPQVCLNVPAAQLSP